MKETLQKIENDLNELVSDIESELNRSVMSDLIVFRLSKIRSAVTELAFALEIQEREESI
jgi:hypothetical protein